MDFEVFVAVHGLALARVARLLTRTRDDADDLTQTILERAFARWPRISRLDDPHAYVRRMLVNATIDASRTLRRRPRSTTLPELADPTDALREVHDRDALRSWLAALPSRQRAAVVLRHYVGLSELETAEALGISTGAVKSYASRGLARLRADQEVHRD